jgi:hypothetical protein
MLIDVFQKYLQKYLIFRHCERSEEIQTYLNFFCLRFSGLPHHFAPRNDGGGH